MNVNSVNNKIFVVGDYAVDSLFFVNNKAKSETPNYKHYDLINQSIIYGGTQLLVDFIKKSTNDEDRVRAFDIRKIYNEKYPIPQKEVPLSINIISEYSEGEKKYRSSSFLGYQDYSPINNMKKRPDLLSKEIKELIKDIKEGDFVILNDYGGILRNGTDLLSDLEKVTSNKKIKFLLKMHKPLFKGEFWDWIADKDPIVVVNPNDLRSCGINISRGLSWERTVNDVISQLFSSRKNFRIVNEIKRIHHLIIWFDVDGALYLNKIDDPNPQKLSYLATLIYDPAFLEEGNKNAIHGSIQGLMSAFFGTFVGHLSDLSLSYPNRKKSNILLSNDHYAILESLEEGMQIARNLLYKGFVIEDNQESSSDKLQLPIKFVYPLITDLKTPKIRYPFVKKTIAEFDLSYDLSDWSIINESGSHFLWREARDIVKYGFKTIKENMPYAQYGKFITFDRMEIESYKEIEKIFRRFAESQKQSISAIGVFGPPGCGKSFGIEELSKSFGEDIFKIIKINLSQVKSPNELTTKFQEIRNATLKGKKPIVIFDEFDSKIDKDDFGWLKYFLSPIQDGEYSDDSGIHPIGAAIFVFAGGTCDTLQELKEGSISLSEEERKKYKNRFKSLKGPDFTSRLIGHINIRGPNIVDTRDSYWVIRRAVLLRSLIEKHMPTILGEEINEKQKANIDDNLIDAFLDIKEYYHGTRSMEAIIRMSASKNKKRFQFSDLPSIEQLNLHVKGIEFNKKLSNKKVISSNLLNSVVKHHFEHFRNYYCLKKINKPEVYNEYFYKSGRVWEKSGFDTAEQEPYFRDSEFFFEILEILGFEYEYSPQITNPNYIPLILPPELLGRILVLEHDRWLIDRVSTGYGYLDPHTFGLKGFPSLIPLSAYENNKSQSKKNYSEYQYLLQFLDQYITIIPQLLSKSGCLLSPVEKDFNKKEITEVIEKINAYYKDEKSHIRKRNRGILIRSKFIIEKLAENLFYKQTSLMKLYFGLVSERNINYKYPKLPQRKKIFFENWAKSITKDIDGLNYSIIPFIEGRGKPNIKSEFNGDEIITLAKNIHKRWFNYLKENGWRIAPGSKSDYEEKRSMMLRQYDELSKKQQNYILNIAKKYPLLLEESGIVLYKLNEQIPVESIITARVNEKKVNKIV